MKEKKIEVDSITLNLGGKKIDLTIPECKKLHEKLTEMFGNITHNHYNNSWTYPYNPNPWITYSANDGVVSFDEKVEVLTNAIPSDAQLSGTNLTVSVA